MSRVVRSKGIVERGVDLYRVEVFGQVGRLVKAARTAGRIHNAVPVGVRPSCRSDEYAAGHVAAANFPGCGSRSLRFRTHGAVFAIHLNQRTACALSVSIWRTMPRMLVLLRLRAGVIVECPIQMRVFRGVSACPVPRSCRLLTARAHVRIERPRGNASRRPCNPAQSARCGFLPRLGA